jgi:outer membrane protein assembly factor BamB
MRISLFFIAALAVFSPAFAGDNWPQFRGPHGDGISDAKDLPTTWSEKENIVWKTAIHDKGWSSPVVWGNQIWMGTADEKGHDYYAICVDRDSGKIVHDIKLFTVEKPDFCIAKNSYASPTPVIEEGRVYLHFGTYGTACLDTKTGKTLWERRDLKCDHWRGPGSSPILYRDLLVVNFDGYDKQYVVALDKKSGKTVWQKDRSFDYGTTNGDLKKAYCTPTILTLGDKSQLISSAAVATTSYDPLTGDELWTVKHGGMNAAIPPLVYDGKVLLFPGDGPIKLLAVRPDGHGDVTKTHIDWTSKDGVPSRCGPVLVDDLLFMVNEGGVVTCLEAKTGKKLWQERVNGSFSSSGILAEGRLYLFNEEGAAYVLEAGREWKKPTVNKLDEGCMASPAVVGKALFVRTKTHLYRIEKP